MHRYYVMVNKPGCILVEAENMDAATDIANHQTEDAIKWSEDGWEVTDAVEDDTLETEECITEKAFD